MLTVEERIKIVLLMAKFENVYIARKEWQKEMEKPAPAESTFRLIFQKFNETGSVLDKQRSGRPSLAEGDVDRIRDCFEETPKCSIRDAAKSLELPYETIRRTLKYTIGMKTFKTTRVHQLLPDDYEPRLSYCQQMKNLFDADPSFLKNLCFSDEAVFHLNGKVNTHNSVIWAYENPFSYEELPLKNPGLTVWAAMFEDKLIGPYFFESTVTKESYLHMLQNYLVPQLKQCRRFSRTVFQQDGAPAHWGLNVREFLNNNFPQRWIGRDGPIHWPARSPDLTPLDYFLWGYVKSLIYKDRPDSTDNLKQRIIDVFQEIPTEMLHKTFCNLIKRVDVCIDNNGGHFQFQHI